MSDLRTTRHALVLCPYCRHKLDACTAGPDNPDAAPREGDATLCIQCGGLLIFDGAPLAPRTPTEAEITECAAFMPVQTMARAIAQLHGLERQQ